MSNSMHKPFEGKKALILGLANDRSLAWSIAQHLHHGGASLAFNFLGEALERSPTSHRRAASDPRLQEPNERVALPK